MRNTIDKYRLCLYCKCLNCKKSEGAKEAYSCKAYPKRYGIPTDVWNKKDVECKYFEAKHPAQDAFLVQKVQCIAYAFSCGKVAQYAECEQAYKKTVQEERTKEDGRKSNYIKTD